MTTSPIETVRFETVRYQVTGMDCSDCAAEIERAANHVTGIEGARVSFAAQTMTLRGAGLRHRLPEVEGVVHDLGYELIRLDSEGASANGSGTSPEREAAYLSARYRRALLTVVLLNVGYGIIETFGGFLSDSQALKADALDFLGDGLITGLGLVAIGWGLTWRARSALIQGVFLGLLGVGVLVNAIYRLQAGYEPEAGLMSLFGVIALVVNIASAFVLIPHRMGDANVRAVWLFSRNDAINNGAVVVAAGAVTWSDTPWPDMVVAVLIAGVFLQSAWSIVKDARRDLHDLSIGS